MLVDRTCDIHGGYKARSAIIMEGLSPVVEGCPTCRGELEQQTRRDAARAAQRIRSEKLKVLLAGAAIPKRYALAAFDNYDATVMGQRQVLAISAAYANTWPTQMLKGGSLVFTGSCGTGKTHLACAIGNAVMAQHMAAVAYYNVPALVRSIKDTYRRDSDKTEKQALANLLMPDLLIIDEVGAKTATDHDLNLLFEVINDRYQDLRPTIVVSNLSRDELEIYLGERAMERFKQDATVLAFDWDSHRGKKVSA